MKEHVLMGDDETPPWKSEGDRSWLDALKRKDEGLGSRSSFWRFSRSSSHRG